MLIPALALAFALSAAPPTPWEEGWVPEGDNAFTVRQGQVRLSLFGRSVVGLSDRVELATNLLFPLPEIPFPNLQLKARLVDGPRFALALDGGVVLGGIPLAGGMAIPLPGAVLGVVGAGFAFASIQNLVVRNTLNLGHVALTLSGGGYLAEAALAGVGLGAGVGGGGALAMAIPVGIGAVEYGPIAAAEIDVPLSGHDALVAEATAFWLGKPIAVEGSLGGLLFPWAGYMHRFDVFAFTVGAYALTDLPHFTMLKDSKLPVAPFVNLSWTFGGRA